MTILKNILLEVPNLKEPGCFKFAVDLALKQNSLLELVTILPDFNDLYSTLNNSQQKTVKDFLNKEAGEHLEKLAGLAESASVATEVNIEHGSKIQKLVKIAVNKESDLLIKDSIEHELNALDHKLIRHSPCPVWLNKKNAPTGPVLLATDLEITKELNYSLNAKLIKYARVLATELQKDLRIIHVWDFDSSSLLRGSVDTETYSSLEQDALELAKQRVADYCEKFQLDSSIVALKQGVPSKRIAKYCEEHHVSNLVIGTVGRKGLAGILVGNTAEHVIDQVNCSLLIVSPDQVKSALEIAIRNGLDRLDDFF